MANQQPTHEHGALLAAHINGQCDCACPDGSFPDQAASGPLIAYLELTAACTNRCAGCCNAYTFGATALSDSSSSLDHWRAVLGQLQPYVQRLKLTGGEPTLYPEFADLCALLDAMALPFDLFTNGCWRDPDEVIRILEGNAQFGGCLISLHGPTASVHEAFSGVRGTFVETQRNIRLALAHKIPVVLSTIITQQNYRLAEDMVTLGEALGVSHIVFNRYVGLPLPGISPSPAELLVAIRQVNVLRAQGHPVKFSVCVPQCFAFSSSKGCVAGLAACTIDPWGNVRPCNHAPVVVGNLVDQELEAVWHSDLMMHWRERPPECQACAEFSVCRGGCRAQAMLTGNGVDPLMHSTPRYAPEALNESTSVDLEAGYVF